jgi:superfamily II DNA/RNA helicase
MASSATGSGKTLMFGLPLLHRVLAASSGSSPRNNGLGQPSSLIIAPTREVSQFLLHASNFVMNVTRALTQAL